MYMGMLTQPSMWDHGAARRRLRNVGLAGMRRAVVLGVDGLFLRMRRAGPAHRDLVAVSMHALLEAVRQMFPHHHGNALDISCE